MDVRNAVSALPPLREVIAAHGLDARKSLGQNFLLDLNLTSRIAREAGPLDHGTVVEIGPGPGGLTRALLLEGAQTLVAIEKDRRCIEALQPLREAADGRLTIVEADALEVDLSAMTPGPVRIAANLPYNIATPLLIDWLRKADAIASMTLMFQKEVAERITAVPGDKAFSRLAVLAGWRCETHLAMTLPPAAFTPPPKVSSAVVRLDPKVPPPRDCTMGALERITAAAFGQRRKMLRGSLKSLGKPLGKSPGVDVPVLLEAAGVSPTVRAEELEIADFVNLARAYSSLRDG